MYFPFTYNLTPTHGVKLSIIYNVVVLLVHVRIFSRCWYFIYMLHTIYNTWLTRLPSGFRLLFLYYIRTSYTGGFSRNENPAACLFYSYYDPCTTSLTPSPSMSTATCCYDIQPRSAYDLPIYVDGGG